MCYSISDLSFQCKDCIGRILNDIVFWDIQQKTHAAKQLRRTDESNASEGRNLEAISVNEETVMCGCRRKKEQ